MFYLHKVLNWWYV